MYTNNRPQFLDQLVAHSKLTPDGRDWLILALDPFHDINHQAAGYPDADGSQTVVSCYQYQMDISAPEGVLGNWDAHVFTMPFMDTHTYSAATEDAGWNTVTMPALGSSPLFGPLNIHTTASGNSEFPTLPWTANAVQVSLPAAPSSDLVSGVSRVIGMGYEVTNTTAEINKQGSVTSYRMPQYTSDLGTILIKNSAGTQSRNPPCYRIRQPPPDVAAANLLKGTRTWDAASGVYATVVQNSVQNPLKQAHNSMAVIEPNAFTGTAATVHFTQFGGASTAAPALSECTPVPTQFAPFDTTGSIFTGLSNATTLTVKLKVYVERAPTYAEPNLAVLATPSAGLDTIALELYAHAISQLPVAVTVGENGLGDWFRGVTRVLKSVAGAATSMLGPIVPGATQVGNAVQTILGTVDSFIPRENRVSVSDSIKPRPTGIRVVGNPKKTKTNKNRPPSRLKGSQLRK